METSKMQRELDKLYEECVEMYHSLGFTTESVLSISINGRLKTSIGRCRYGRINGNVANKIEMNKKFLEHNLINGNLKEIKHTILHEIAHSIAGYNAGHGRAWKAIVDEVGQKYGYVINQFHDRTETVIAIQAERAQKRASVPTGQLLCTECGKTHTVKVTSVHYKKTEEYRCRCGGKLIKKS